MKHEGEKRNPKQVENIMSKFAPYTDGVRTLMLTHRGKDGGKSDRPDRFAIKRISTDKEDFAVKLVELCHMKFQEKEKPLRIYSSLNARSMKKHIREFKRRQLDADYYDIQSRYKFYRDVKNQWFSSMMKPNSKNGSLFLIDIDSTEEYAQFQVDWNERMITQGTILDRFPTKNGWHVITEPFNPTLMSEYDIKKDGLLLLDW